MGEAKAAKATKAVKAVTPAELARVASELQSALRRGGVTEPFRIVTSAGPGLGRLAILVQDDATLPVAVRASQKGGYSVTIWPEAPIAVSSTWAINEAQLVARYQVALNAMRALEAVQRETTATIALANKLIEDTVGGEDFIPGASVDVNSDGMIRVVIDDMLEAKVHPAMTEVATVLVNACATAQRLIRK